MIDPTKMVRMVVLFDPAIDRAKTDIIEYERSRDPAIVHALPGQTLQWIHLRPLLWSETTFCAARPSLAERDLACFQLGCVAIENHFPGGGTLSPKQPTRRPNGTEVAVWLEDEMEEIHARYRHTWMREVGRLVWELADSPNVLNGGACFTAPPSSGLAVESTKLRLVERAKRIDGIASSARFATPSIPIPPESSDAATPAPATAPTGDPAASV